MTTDSLVRALGFKNGAPEAEAVLLRMVAIREEALSKNRPQEASCGSDSAILASVVSLKRIDIYSIAAMLWDGSQNHRNHLIGRTSQFA